MKHRPLDEIGRVRPLIERGGLFICNHSGGKDSQAMLIRMLVEIPAEQIVVMHATLGEFEWRGALELARDQARDAGCHFIVAHAVNKTGAEKDFFDLVNRRRELHPEWVPWPGKNNRYCTSDLKRTPIEREIRRYMKPRHLSLIINCLGERADESDARRKKPAFEYDADNSKAGREWYEWLPIKSMTRDEVFATIAAAGQKPHAAYAAGNNRLSCMFCVFGSKRDLANAAAARPDLFKRYCEMEKATGYPMHAFDHRPLAELVAEGAAGIGDVDHDFERGCSMTIEARRAA